MYDGKPKIVQDNIIIILFLPFLCMQMYFKFSTLFSHVIYLLYQLYVVFIFSERELMESLPLSSQCPEEEIELVRFLYENKLKKVISILCKITLSYTSLQTIYLFSQLIVL
jgi:hypothetical protein